MTFAYSQRALAELVNRKFTGEWKYLRKSLFEIAETRATRALLELGLLLRVVDDAEGISDFLRQTQNSAEYGKVFKPDGSCEPLYIRDLTNKLLHATRFEWKVMTEEPPSVASFSDNTAPNKWSHAMIDLNGLAAFCGMLMS